MDSLSSREHLKHRSFGNCFTDHPSITKPAHIVVNEYRRKRAFFFGRPFIYSIVITVISGGLNALTGIFIPATDALIFPIPPFTIIVVSSFVYKPYEYVGKKPSARVYRPPGNGIRIIPPCVCPARTRSIPASA